MNYKWSDFISNDELYGTNLGYKHKLRFISERLRERRLTFLGHCWRSRNIETGAPQPISDVMFWTCPGKQKVGRPRNNFISILKRDLKFDDEADVEEFQVLMDDRDLWIKNAKGGKEERKKKE